MCEKDLLLNHLWDVLSNVYHDGQDSATFLFDAPLSHPIRGCGTIGQVMELYDTTTVVFRKWKDDGAIIALMPEVAVNLDPYKCQSYMHVGQHSAASCNLTNATVPAKPEEYADLLAELESIGYRVKIAQRITRKMHDIREREVYKWRRARKETA